jgi:hypothetical protein
MRFLSRTPVRTFIIYPIVTVVWEFISRGGSIRLDPGFAAEDLGLSPVPLVRTIPGQIGGAGRD